MKRIISLILACALILSGCAQAQGTSVVTYETEQEEVQNESLNNSDEVNKEVKETDQLNEEIPTAEEEDADPSPYEYVVDFESLDDADLMRYVEDNIYAELVEKLDSDEYLCKM